MPISMAVSKTGFFRIHPSRCRKGQCGWHGATQFRWAVYVTGDGTRLDGNRFLIDNACFDEPFERLSESTDACPSCEDIALTVLDSIKSIVSKQRGTLSGIHSIRVVISGSEVSEIEAIWTR